VRLATNPLQKKEICSLLTEDIKIIFNLKILIKDRINQIKYQITILFNY